MSFCQGNIKDCEADEDLCPICLDVMACSIHGHVDAGAVAGCLFENDGETQDDGDPQP